MKILMVLTSHNKLGDTGRKTGFWLEEFAAPYFTFLDAGATVTVEGVLPTNAPSISISAPGGVDAIASEPVAAAATFGAAAPAAAGGANFAISRCISP